MQDYGRLLSKKAIFLPLSGKNHIKNRHLNLRGVQKEAPPHWFDADQSPQ